jgi:SAM-dependent methyltransferase
MKVDVQSKRFSYADYEKAIRQPHYDYLRTVSKQNATYFESCQRVLDIASGQGFLLDALSEMGIPAWGVDNETNLVEMCRNRGLTVIEDDLFHFLTTTEEHFDGVSCNHIIEHMPYEALIDLIEGVHRVLNPGGVLLLNWPNPRSASTQFSNFWKDPTHSRFYDGDFVKAVLSFYGFQLVETHYDSIEPINYTHDAMLLKTSESAESGNTGTVGLHKVVRYIGRRIIRTLGLDHLIGQHRLNSSRLQVFDLPGDARIVARRS